ncbi:MAG: Clp protease N-terminal domain-containing protein [Nocardioidaceae bacterium]
MAETSAGSPAGPTASAGEWPTVSDLVREIEEGSPPAASPQTHLTAAVLAAERLAEVGDELVDHFVQSARRVGVSWAEIGGCLGVSKQAAQQRFVSERGNPGARRSGYLERFADGAVAAVDLAQDESVALGHSYIGTEHLLLGLLRVPDGVAARVLAAAGVHLDDARAEAERIVGRGKGSPDGMLPLTPRSKKTLETALKECRARSGAEPDTGDVLLGLLRDGKGVGPQILGRLAGDLTRLRAATLAAAQS